MNPKKFSLLNNKTYKINPNGKLVDNSISDQTDEIVYEEKD